MHSSMSPGYTISRTTRLSTKPHMRPTHRNAQPSIVSSLLALITAKIPGNRPTALNPNAYDDIFLGYHNTLDNIKYWDIHTGSRKTARHDSKDELQYGANPSESSPASDHLLSIFTESDPSDHITNTGPEPVVLPIIKNQLIDPTQVAQEILEQSLLPYTTADADRVYMRVNRTDASLWIHLLCFQRCRSLIL